MTRARTCRYRVATGFRDPHPTPRHPYGLRGVGEIPIIAPLAALSNAIYHAIGVRLTRLPMSPGAILEALEAKP
jgi:xanthine dehydrogenase molybdenum-binding subunit